MVFREEGKNIQGNHITLRRLQERKNSGISLAFLIVVQRFTGTDWNSFKKFKSKRNYHCKTWGLLEIQKSIDMLLEYQWPCLEILIININWGRKVIRKILRQIGIKNLKLERIRKIKLKNPYLIKKSIWARLKKAEGVKRNQV